MKDLAPPTDRRDRLASLLAPRGDAIPLARSHSRRVRRLRRLSLWGAGGVLASVLIGLAVHSLRFLPIDLRFARIATKDGVITIESPKLVGYRKDGRPYELRARTAVQDIAKPNEFDLEQLDVRIESDDGSIVTLEAGHGFYNAKSDHADLSQGAHLFDGRRYDMRAERAAVDFAANVVTTDSATTLTLDRSVVTAEAAQFSQNERRATFIGAVHTTIPGDDEAEEKIR